MSAQAVLSMIAPVLPATPQGASGGDAAEFQGLLASMLPNGTSDGMPAKAAKPIEGPSAEAEAERGIAGDPVAAPGLLTIPLPVPSVQPAVSPVQDSVQPKAEEAVTTDSGPATPATPAPVAPPAPPAPALPQGEWAAPVATVQADAPLPSIQPPLIETPAGKDAEKPAASPPAAVAAVAAAVAVPADAKPVAMATTDPEQAVPVTASPEQMAAAAPGAKNTAPSEAPVQLGASRTAAQPPLPLRPLTERTSQPLDRSVSGSATATEATGGRSPAQAPASPETGASAGPAAKPAAAAVSTAQPAAERTAADAPPPPDTASSPTESTASAREHQSSTLSRATLDATVQIAAQIARKLEGRSTRFEIALRPDELGRVDVKLDIDSEGRLAARLAFDNPAAATDLRGRADELRRQLENAGFQLADDAFEFTERDSGSSAFDRGQDARHGQNRAFKASARLNAEIDIAQPPQWLSLSLSPSGVDMKV